MRYVVRIAPELFIDWLTPGTEHHVLCVAGLDCRLNPRVEGALYDAERAEVTVIIVDDAPGHGLTDLTPIFSSLPCVRPQRVTGNEPNVFGWKAAVPNGSFLPPDGERVAAGPVVELVNDRVETDAPLS